MGSYLSMYLGTAKATQAAHLRKRRSPWFPWTGPVRDTCPMGRDGRPILSYRRRRQDHGLWFRSRRPLPAALRRWKYYPVRGSSGPQGWRRLPNGPPLRTSSGLGFSGHGNGFTMRSRWNARLSCHTQSLLDIRTTPLESLSSLSTCPPSQESPDRCAKEGQRRLDVPLRSESPEPRLSAFRPVVKNGVVPVFVPRPGPLRRSICSGCKRLREEDTEPRPDQQP
ncbi:PREDICTED: POM121-like protein 2-like [Lipotes vexillifer]|uniref:POM121-like protein 2-like n=1 Tax=Lipotes vexillifer TaxID=118797 RepID=A0A340X3G6_LIPVE|nr:PREDICTED: POM121-like protein 2-like [Lipotes vexillifer]